ncbi:deoxycytidylate deaminase [Varunaivibrio sulfuroxidans]|uniref:dCMP deaminase n=1 Tax=Varunaivibrio sulfuroxidans TaxID=1773489 RepID=A0A4R3JCZ8_9PROT|nr:deaminase [Varunaivibrio sulfuroxidans]TCS63544.1 dCMP deaminase [Varunaivibrio sulfuroxidans]WES30311.1 deaminase [Varunaivibrio sulfuroxidans]
MSEKWDARFVRLAREISSWSKDRSTKVGAVIVADDKTPGPYGYNGFPRTIDDDLDERHQRPIKYDWTEHAERNAIYNATRTGMALKNCTIYVTHVPCPDCARAIVQVGITRVVVDEASLANADFGARWDDRSKVSMAMLKEAGVTLDFASIEAAAADHL